MRRLVLPIVMVVTVSGCPSPGEPDSGVMPVVDASTPIPCDSPEDCRVAGFDGVCRQNLCAAAVPCADDLECGLAESCVGQVCRFTGCIEDGDCPTGHCRTASFDCAECGSNADCPFSRPVCQQSTNTCVSCTDDSQCPVPGPGFCDAASGSCVHCRSDEHCPPGLSCAAGICTGVPSGGSCPMGTACAQGLTCVNVGTAQRCLTSCSLYAPNCATGEICYALKYSDSTSLVFDMGAPLGVCFAPQAGAAGYRSACTRTAATNTCQPNLQCVPSSATESRCRTYCDPGAATNPCPSPEICHPFPGDFSGRRYGLCYDDNGFGQSCVNDTQCRAGLSCVPYDDPGAFELLSPVCQFSVGAAKGLAPCAAGVRPDGGVRTADQACSSGACVGDSFPSSGDYYCYAACTQDTDCSIDGRSGICDGDFQFPTADGTTSAMRGCRPGCVSDARCRDYEPAFTDGGTVVCRPTLTTGTTPRVKQACGVPTGTWGAGSACNVGSDCRSGYCALEDSRGVRRRGYCLEPCETNANCAASPLQGAITGPLTCAPTALLGYRGNDGVGGTADDRFVVSSFCVGQACTTDVDCGGALCVPQASGGNPSTLALACRPPTATGLAGGASCTSDVQCLSGLCAAVDASDGGTTGKACFMACDGATVCPGATTCRQAFHVTSPGGPMTFSGCAP